MGMASRMMKRRTVLEKLAAERGEMTAALEKIKNAVTELSEVLVTFARGSNWIIRDLEDIMWVGEGNPNEIADKVLKHIFGPNYMREYTGLQKERDNASRDK